jgi:hypothetical protein
MAYIPTPIDLVDPGDSVASAFGLCNQNFEDISNMLTEMGALISGGFDYTRSGVTGGGSGALDGIDGDDLTGGETAIVIEGLDPARFSIYKLSAEKGGAEAAPYVITPDTNPGTKRWVLATRPTRVWAGAASPTVNDDTTLGIRQGDTWIYNGAMWFCLDDTDTAAVWLPMLALGTSGTTACAGNDGRLPSNSEKSALAGTTGTPGSDNKYVTNSDTRMSDARTPASHGSSVHSGTIGTESQITFSISTGHAHTGVDSMPIAYSSLGSVPSYFTPDLHGVSAHEGYIGDEDQIVFSTTEGHTHDGVDSRHVSYTDLSDIPNAFTPVSHGASSHSSNIGTESQIAFDYTAGHAHTGSDSKQIAHSNLSGAGTTSHSNIDSYLPSSGQKSALAGTSGTPGSDNKYVTDGDSRMTNSRAPTAHGSSLHSGTIGAWSQIDKTTSSIGDIASRSHSSLTDIGTNAHSTIDTFISSKNAASGLAPLDADSLVPTGNMGTGTANITTFLRGDHTWAAPPTQVAGSANQIQYNSGSGFTASANLTFDGTTFYVAGRAGIGIAGAASTTLNVANTLASDPGADRYGLAAAVNIAALSSNSFRSFYSLATASHTSGTVASLYGAMVGPYASGSGGTVTDGIGIYSTATAASGATITNGYGFKAGAAGAGAFTNWYGVFLAGSANATTINAGAYVYNLSTSVACSNQFAVYVGAVSGASAVANHGILVGNVSGSSGSNYSIKTGTGQVYFGDVVSLQAAQTNEKEVILKEISTPTNPSAGYMKLYAKTDHKLYMLNSSGTETSLT